MAAIIAVMIFGSPVKAESLADNARLEELFRLDQQDWAGYKTDRSEVQARDISRQDIVRSLLLDGQLRTAGDFYHAAMIFRHGSSVDDERLAYSLATLAASISPTEGRYRLLAAAMWDRLSGRDESPFGTQPRYSLWSTAVAPALVWGFIALVAIASLAFGYRNYRQQKKWFAERDIAVVAGQDYRARGAELAAMISDLKAKSRDLERWGRAVDGSRQ